MNKPVCSHCANDNLTSFEASKGLCFICRKQSNESINSHASVKISNNIKNQLAFDKIRDQLGYGEENVKVGRVESLERDIEKIYIDELGKREGHFPKKYGFSRPGLHWETSVSRWRLMNIIRLEYSPNILIKDAGGSATWKDIPGWVKIVVMDKAEVSFDPMVHLDVMHATKYMPIPDMMLQDIFFISSSVSYDRPKKEITVSCNFIGAAIATIAMIKLYLKGYMSKEVAKANCTQLIPELYTEFIQALGASVDIKFARDRMYKTGSYEYFINGSNVFGVRPE